MKKLLPLAFILCGSSAFAQGYFQGQILPTNSNTWNSPQITQGISLPSWGNYGAVVCIEGWNFNTSNCPIMGGFSTASGQATYGSRDYVNIGGGVYDNPSFGNGGVAVTSYSTTGLTFTSAQNCTLFRSRSGNNGGTLLATSDSPFLSGEVTARGTCDTGSTTTTGLTVSGWFQVVGQFADSITSLGSGGTGYAVNDVLFCSGGHGYMYRCKITVNTVNGGGTILTYTLTYGGSYQSGGFHIPANPVAVTGGLGTGATFNLHWAAVAGNTAAGQTPAGATVLITPATKMWGENINVVFQGNGSTRDGVPTEAAADERDITNNSGTDDILYTATTPLGYLGSLWGMDVVNLGANFSGNAYVCRGLMLDCFIAGDGTNAVRYGYIYNPPASQTGTENFLFSTQQRGNVLVGSSALVGTNLLINQFGATGEITDLLNDAGQLSLGSESVSTSNPYLRFYTSATAAGSPDTAIVPSGGTGNVDGTLAENAATVQLAQEGSTTNGIEVGHGAAASGDAFINSFGGDSNVNVNITAKGTNTINLATGGTNSAALGTLQTKIKNTTGATDYATLTGGSGGATVSVDGTSTNDQLSVVSKGTGAIVLQTNGGTTQAAVSNVASAVDYVNLSGAATGAAPTVQPAGTDSNITLLLKSKGTGTILERPGTDGTAAARIQNAAGTTTYVNVDSTNNVVSIVGSATAGSTPTLTGTCTTGSQHGGNTAGDFTATCTSQTVIIGFASTMPNGWVCNAQDETTSTDSLKQTAHSTTSCTLTGTTVASDRIVFSAIGY